MHIFRHAKAEARVETLVSGLAQAMAAGEGLEVLLAAARLECGLSDGWSEAAGEDDWDGARSAAMEVVVHAAQYYLGQAPRRRWPEVAARLAPHLPPAQTRLAVGEMEGARYYGLWPAGYAVAARRWQAAAGEGAGAWVLGLRSMGSVLAPVVVAALARGGGEHRCLTLRPVDAPWDRRVRTSARLRQQISAWPGEFLIVDEGPGLSGSTFGGVVAFLTGLGVAAERIAVLPGWELGREDAARLRSEYAARGWMGWRRFAAAPLPAPTAAGERVVEVSAGRWREAIGIHQDWPVWGQHERRKFLTENGRTLVKFAGLGGYGRQTLERARRLAQMGWGPALAEEGEAEIQAGWIGYQRLAARPLPTQIPQGWTEFAGAYLAWVRSEFAWEQQVEGPSPPLREMAKLNLERLLGMELRMEAMAGVPVALDGRMLAVEWGRTADGWVKFDGTDHGDDPFFPGPADIAWDLAAVGVEFGPACGEAVLAAYCRHSGEERGRARARRVWHEIAYSAFRAAFCLFAASQTGAPDAERFRAAGERYRKRCARYMEINQADR